MTSDVLGEIGTWQWFVTLVSTVLMMPSIFSHYEDVHLLHPSYVTCLPSEGHEVKEQFLCTYTVFNSTEEIKCNVWHVKLLWLIWVKKTVCKIRLTNNSVGWLINDNYLIYCFVIQWLVFCNDNTKQLSTTMICRLGLIFGFVIYGVTADRWASCYLYERP